MPIDLSILPDKEPVERQEPGRLAVNPWALPDPPALGVLGGFWEGVKEQFYAGIERSGELLKSLSKLASKPLLGPLPSHEPLPGEAAFTAKERQAEALGKRIEAGLESAGREVQSYAKIAAFGEPLIHGDPRWRNRPLSENIKDPVFLAHLAGSGLSSFATSMAPQLLGVGLGFALGGPGGAVAGLTASMGLNMYYEAGDTRELLESLREEKGLKVTDEQIDELSAAAGVVAGALDFIPGFHAIKSSPIGRRLLSSAIVRALAETQKTGAQPIYKSLLERLVRASTIGVFEGVTETFQGIVRNVAANLIDSGHPLLTDEDVMEGIAGFFGGTILGLPLSGKVTRGRQEPSITTSTTQQETLPPQPPYEGATPAAPETILQEKAAPNQEAELLRLYQRNVEGEVQEWNRIKNEVISAGRPAEEAEMVASLVAARAAVVAQQTDRPIYEVMSEYRFARGEDAPVRAKETGLSQYDVGGIKGGYTRIETRHVIEFFSAADPTTAPHELGHAFLEELRDISQRPDAPEDVRKQVETLFKEFGISSWDELTTEHHERWAELWTKYLAEGKAPVEELAGIFGMFRRWLLAIYRWARTRFNAEISPGMREVFDHLLATEEEIRTARFNSAAEELLSKEILQGASEEDLEQYRNLLRQAREKAEATILERRFAQRGKEARRLRAEARELASEAYSWLEDLIRRGGLNVNDLDMVVGEEGRSEIAAKFPGLVSKEGLTIEEASHALGTQAGGVSGQWELIERLRATPSKSQFIQDHVAEGLKEYDRQTSTDDAYLSEEYEKLLDLETTLLAKDLQRAKTTPIRGLSRLIEQQLARHTDDKIVSEYAALVAAYRMAARNAKIAASAARREAEAATKAQMSAAGQRAKERLLAARERQKQALAALKAYYAAKEELRKIRADLAKILRAAPKLGGDYADAIITLLGKHGLTKRVPLKIVEASDIRQIAEEQGEALVLPDSVLYNMIPTTGSRTLQQWRDIRDAARAIFTVGRNRDLMLAREKRLSFLQASASLVAQVLNKHLGPKLGDMLDRLSEYHAETRRLVQDQISAALMSRFEAAEKPNASYKVKARAQALLREAGTLDREEAVTILAGRIMAAIEAKVELATPELAEVLARLDKRGVAAVWRELVEAGGLPGLKNNLTAMVRDRALPENEIVAKTLLDFITKYTTGWRPTAPSEREKRGWEKIATVIRSANSHLLKVDTILRLVDRWDKTHKTAMNLLFEPILDGRRLEAGLSKEMFDGLRKILEKAIPDKRRFLQRQTIPGVPQVMTRQEIFCVALNSGNEGNRNAILAGFGWSEEQLQAVLNSLTKEEWDGVVGIWRHIEKLWPRISDTFEQLSGRRLRKVEPITVQTPYGEVEGGYYPLIFDRDLSFKADRFSTLREAEDLFRTIYAQANPRDQFTIERKGGKMAPMLSLGVLTTHLHDVIRYVSYATPIRDVWKLVHAPSVRAAMSAAIGEERWKQIPLLYQEVAKPQRPPMTGLEKVLRWTRETATIVMLGLRFMTGLKNFAGYTQTISEIGLKDSLPGLARVLSNPLSAVREARELSPIMEARDREYERDMRSAFESAGKIPGLDSAKRKLLAAYFVFIRMFDIAATYSTFWSAYYKSMRETADPEIAVKRAEELVIRAQVAFHASETAAVQRGGEAQRLLTLFYTWCNRLHNLTVERWWEFKYGEISLPRLMVAYWWLLVVPGALVAFLERRKKPEEYAAGIFTYATSGIPVWRDVAPFLLYGYPYGFTPSADVIETIAGIPQAAYKLLEGDLDQEQEFMQWMKILDGVLTGARIPSKQVVQTLRAWYYYDQGRLDSPVYLLTGARKEELAGTRRK